MALFKRGTFDVTAFLNLFLTFYLCCKYFFLYWLNRNWKKKLKHFFTKQKEVVCSAAKLWDPKGKTINTKIKVISTLNKMKRGTIPQMFQNPLSRIFDSQRYPIILAPAQCCYNVLFLSAASTIPYHKLFSFPYISFYFLFLIRSQHEVKLSLKSRLFHLLPLFNRGSTCIIWFRLGSVKISLLTTSAAASL